MFDPRSLPVPFRMQLADEDDEDKGKGGSGGSDKEDADKKKDNGKDDTSSWEDDPKQWRKWRELARKHEGQSKANADKAKRFDELEEASKSELQKAADKAAEAEKRAAEAEQRALRMEIAHAKGLTPAQAKRLVGSTKEELETDADELLETFGTTDDGKKPPSRKPNERLRSSTSSDDDDTEPSVEDIVAKVPRY